MKIKDFLKICRYKCDVEIVQPDGSFKSMYRDELTKEDEEIEFSYFEFHRVSGSYLISFILD